VAYHERTIGKLLEALGFSHVSARPRHPKQDGEVVQAFKKNFPRTLAAHLAGVTRKKKIEIWFQDEARIGQKNGLVRQWARRSTRPIQPADQRYESACLFGAICPARGVGAALAQPFADTDAISVTSTRSPSTSPEARTPCCCWTGPDGAPPAISSGRGTSRRSCCRRARRSSIRSSRPGNICVPTTSPTASSTTTTPSSTQPARHGVSPPPAPRGGDLPFAMALGVRPLKSPFRGFSFASQTTPHTLKGGGSQASRGRQALRSKILLQPSHFQAPRLQRGDGLRRCVHASERGVVGHFLHQRGAAERF